MHFSVVSDLHLGSPYCQDQAFLRFLATLPTDSALILNGDILDEAASECHVDGLHAATDAE